MRVRLPAVSWRIAASAVLSLVCVLALLGVVSAEYSTGNRATSKATQATLSSRGSARMMGTVDLRKLSATTAGQSASAQSHIPRDRMTPQQRAAYWAQAQRGVNVPKAPSTTQKTPSVDPKFLGGSIVPPYLLQAQGMGTSTLGTTDLPHTALATDLSYLMEGVDTAVAIYRTSNGTLAYGPYTADSFFAPIKHAGDTFSNPQMNYDVMRDHWIVTYLEWTPSGLSYLDIAVSTSNSPTQPVPGAQYHEFQVPTTFLGGTTACDYQTLGIEYYSLTITCVEFDTSNVFKGNTTIVFDKNSLLNSNTATYYAFNNVVNTSLNTCGGPCPAFRLSPAIEDGTPDGEFIVATDVGYGVTSNNLTLCALTNLNNISTTAPTLTCGLNNLGLSYADPIPIVLNAGPLPPVTFTVESGPRQIYFKAGRLFVSFTSALSIGGGPRNDVLWAEVQPQLSTKATHSPQWVNGALITQVSYWDPIFGGNVFSPTLMGTDEDDLVLIFQFVSVGGVGDDRHMYMIYSGRKATDAPNTMGQNAGTFSYKSFPGDGYVTSTNWRTNTACAVPLNSVTRGIVWCVSPLTWSDSGGCPAASSSCVWSSEPAEASVSGKRMADVILSPL
ncbi:MAG TPA: hypothetical protein VH393_07230 [Ktedonobacterales bacterium]